MFLLLALLECLAPLLPQTWRACVQRRAVRQFTPDTPARRDELQSLGAALIDAAQTDEQIWTAIAFDCRTRATAMAHDKSHAFHRDRARRMTRLRTVESHRPSKSAPVAATPRALELSG